MSTPTSIYHSFAQLIELQHQNVSPAELQGLLLGRSCAGASSTCLEDAAVLFDGDIPTRIQEAISGLHEMLQTELKNQQLMAVTLLLPEDESPLQLRIQALAQWCQGFLSGFGSHAANLDLSAQTREILDDLVAISQLDNSPELIADNDDENSYMELVEYLRITPVLLYTEHVKQTTTDQDSKPAAIH